MEKGFRTHEGLTAHFSRFFLGFKKGGARPVYKCICRSLFFKSLNNRCFLEYYE